MEINHRETEKLLKYYLMVKEDGEAVISTFSVKKIEEDMKVSF